MSHAVSSRMVKARRSPEVNSYVDDLARQMLEVCARYGVDHPAKLAPLIKDGTVPSEDVRRFRELRLALMEAATENCVPSRNTEWKKSFFEKAFAYDKEKAAELGFSELRVEAHPKAQELMDAIYNRDPRFMKAHAGGGTVPDENTIKAYWQENCADLPFVFGGSDLFLYRVAEHLLSDTIDRDVDTTPQTMTRSHIPRFSQAEFVLAMDWKEFNHEDATEEAAAVSPQTRAMFKRLFGQEGVVDISRDTLNRRLFSDHDERVPSERAIKVIRDLIGPGQDPNDYELRLMRVDEYVRVATSKEYGRKNLWTWLDGYARLSDEHRAGLVGGNRQSGSVAGISAEYRVKQGRNTAVRLVLSRKGA